MENINNYPNLLITVSKTSTPDYAGKIARGEPLPENPYSLFLFKSPLTNLRLETEYWKNGKLSYTLYDNSMSAHADSEPRLTRSQRREFETAIIGNATNAALAKIKGQSLPIIQMYLERKEVAGFLAKLIDDSIFIARNVKRPAKIFKYFRAPTNTRRYRTVRSKVKAIMLRKGSSVGDAWLQYRMFLVPTYSDVLSSLNAASDYEKKSHTFEVVATKNVNETSRISYDTYNSVGILTAERPGTMTVSGGVTVKIKYSITDSSLSALSSLTDIKAVMWDLVPWSFIVDRFADISTYLELSNATIGTTLTKGTVSSMFCWNGSLGGPWVAYYPNKLTYKVSGRLTRKAGMPGCPLYDLAVRRTVLSSFPTPVLEFPFRQGWKQITDEIILVRKLLAKKLGS